MNSPSSIAAVITGVARATARERIRTNGLFFYALVWVSPALFSALLVVFIYRDAPALRDYAIIGGAGAALLFGMQFNAGQILDEQRQDGTLGNLFAAPVPRFAWLAGFQLFAVIEALVAAAVTVGVSSAVFGLTLSVDELSLLVVVVLMLSCMWGFSMVVGAIGLALRDANQLSNLLSPFTVLLAGTMLPLDRMPTWLSIPAHCLPFSYGIQAMAASVTQHASLADVSDDVLPLAAFAAIFPFLGIGAFRAVERRIRRAGALDLV